MSNEVPLVDLIAFGNLRMATIRALSIDEADKVIAAIECRDAEIARLRAECDDLAADVRRLQTWGEGLARENAELRAENVRLKVDHRIVQLLTRLIRVTRPIRVKEDDYDEPS
jgi:hypothetical protein